MCKSDFYIIELYLLLFSTENDHSMPETLSHIEEMETVIMEVEV